MQTAEIILQANELTELVENVVKLMEMNDKADFPTQDMVNTLVRYHLWSQVIAEHCYDKCMVLLMHTV